MLLFRLLWLLFPDIRAFQTPAACQDVRQEVPELRLHRHRVGQHQVGDVALVVAGLVMTAVSVIVMTAVSVTVMIAVLVVVKKW